MKSVWVVTSILGLLGCTHDAAPPEPEQRDSLSRTRPPRPAAPIASFPERPACPRDMQLVEGGYCSEAEQICEQHHPDYLKDRGRSERCLRFREPSKCLSPGRESMRFCVDRYEYPNRAGERPRVLTSWPEAKKLCEAADKRLCSEQEWLFACEGEAMLPYTYGFRRDPTACVMDRMYIPVEGTLKRWDECLSDALCAGNLARLDQREPAGAFKRCRSPFGVFDMNGNVNEWVEIPGERYPNRAGLKGGWWGPVRDRCRPTVRFHKEDDWGYEVGFRCCRDSLP